MSNTIDEYYAWLDKENIRLMDELITTRKALDVARNGLEYIFGYEGVPKYVVKHIRQVLDQINEIKGVKMAIDDKEYLNESIIIILANKIEIAVAALRRIAKFECQGDFEAAKLYATVIAKAALYDMKEE